MILYESEIEQPAAGANDHTTQPIHPSPSICKYSIRHEPCQP